MRRRGGVSAAVVASAWLAAACSSGASAPANFVGATGDQWALPLVGPLEDNLLLTPVLIDGVGPFLFAIDPDANVSIVDEHVVKELRLLAVKGPARLDESSTEQPRFYTDIRGVELGSLIVENLTAMIARKGALDQNGRRIHGVLGRDALADSLVFSFDRDLGVAYLTVAEKFRPPAGAIELAYAPLRMQGPSNARPLDRRIVRAVIHGHELAMHVDLGAANSQLRETTWGAIGLAPVDGRATLVDEVGSVRRATRATIAENVSVGRASSPRVVFVPYEDQRFPTSVDGTLGLDFFRTFKVAVNWDKKMFYVSPRHEAPAAQRIARWEVGALGQCKSPGCVTVRIVDPTIGKTLDPSRPHPGVVLSVTREEIAGGMDLEVVLEAKNKPELPRIALNLSPNSDRVLSHLKPEWAGVELTVVDASPFARPCPNADGCVDLLAR